MPHAAHPILEPLCKTDRVKVLLVPGLNGSPESHWQSVWERERADCEKVDLGSWSNPDPQTWIERLDHYIRRECGPVVLAAHSLGCVATVLWSRRHYYTHPHPVIGALLVAPCDTDTSSSECLRRFAPLPTERLTLPTTLIASANDPYATPKRSRQMAASWGSEFVEIGRAGHINAQSDLGMWRYGQTMLDRIKQKTRPDVRR